MLENVDMETTVIPMPKNVKIFGQDVFHANGCLRGSVRRGFYKKSVGIPVTYRFGRHGNKVIRILLVKDMNRKRHIAPNPDKQKAAEAKRARKNHIRLVNAAKSGQLS